MLQKTVLSNFFRRKMTERFAGLGSMDDPTGVILKALMEDEELMANIEKEIPMEIIEQIANSRQASLSVSQALEKAKSLSDGNILRQESYQDILNQVDVRDRYPFTIALVEHEIKVADRKVTQGERDWYTVGEPIDLEVGDTVEVEHNGKLIRTEITEINPIVGTVILKDPDYPLGEYQLIRAISDVKGKKVGRKAFQSVEPGTAWIRSQDGVVAEIISINSDGSIYAQSSAGGLLYDSASEWLDDFRPHDLNADKTAAVDLVTRDETEKNINYSHYSDFPAGEIPDESSGQSELDYPSIRRVEGIDHSAGFEDLASPQEQFVMQDLIGKGDMDGAWNLLKDVSERTKIKDGEIGNSLIDLTTEKWGSMAKANDEVNKTGNYDPDAFLTLDQIDAGLGPCLKKRKP